MVTGKQDTRSSRSSTAELPEVDDDIRFVVDRARALTLDALENGWSGPPFDPIALAKYLGIEVEPREDIPDARIVPQSAKGKTNRFKIQFNPIRSKGRIRFSIAHEIAHTFFPDCADRVRNREQKDELTADDWRLEMLCNIGAAELIMPIGSFPDLRKEQVSIDRLMELRQEYDVSIEALLLRFIRLTDIACALFASSCIESGPDDGRYKIDYAISSRAWRSGVPIGGILREGTLVAGCTAIGYTAKGEDHWPPDQRVWIECVGAPPYPGRSMPRVLGLVLDPTDCDSITRSITYLVGDVLELRGDGPVIIAHVVNDRSANWGAGLAKQIAIRYTDAQVDFRKWARDEDNFQLERVHFFGSPKKLEIASMVAQQGYGRSVTPRIKYPALRECLRQVGDRALETNASVHMPRIGCGLAGGSWSVVEEIVEDELVRRGVTVVVFDLPPGQRAPSKRKRG